MKYYEINKHAPQCQHQWYKICIILYLWNKYVCRVVIVGRGPFQVFVSPHQSQATRGNHFLLDFVDLNNAAEKVADVKPQWLLLVHNRTNF